MKARSLMLLTLLSLIAALIFAALLYTGTVTATPFRGQETPAAAVIIHLPLLLKGGEYTPPEYITYVNEEHGYSFDYPADWNLFAQGCIDHPPFKGAVHVTVEFKDDCLDVIDWLHWHSQMYPSLYWGVDEAIPSDPNATIAGQPAVFLMYPATDRAPSHLLTLLVRDNLAFEIHCINSEFAGTFRVYHHVLETFELEGVTPATDLSSISSYHPYTAQRAPLLQQACLAQSCCEYTMMTTNRYECLCWGTTGNCVWYGMFKRPELALQWKDLNWWWGNACTWADNARQLNFPVGNVPTGGSIGVVEHPEPGHVVYVEYASSGSAFDTTEMSCGEYNCVKPWDYPHPSRALPSKFIYHRPELHHAPQISDPRYVGQPVLLDFWIHNPGSFPAFSRLSVKLVDKNGHEFDYQITSLPDTFPMIPPSQARAFQLAFAPNIAGTWCIKSLEYEVEGGHRTYSVHDPRTYLPYTFQVDPARCTDEQPVEVNIPFIHVFSTCDTGSFFVSLDGKPLLTEHERAKLRWLWPWRRYSLLINYPCGDSLPQVDWAPWTGQSIVCAGESLPVPTPGPGEPTPPPGTVTPPPPTDCEPQGTWAEGLIVGLYSGTKIYTGAGFAYPVDTVVSDENWPVLILDGPRGVDGCQWWHVTREFCGLTGPHGWVADCIPPSRTPTPVPCGPPALLEPEDGAAFNAGDQILLRWSGNCDEYLCELWRGDETHSTDWTTSTEHWSPINTPGTVYWHVKCRCNGEETEWSETRSYTVHDWPPCDTPQLVSPPTEQDFEIPATVNLQWTGNCAQYYVEWSRNASYNPVEGHSAWTSQTTYPFNAPGGTTSGKVYWHVKGRTTQGVVAGWSETRNFDLIGDPLPCSVPVLDSPADGATFDHDERIVLRWHGDCEEYNCRVRGAVEGWSGWTRQMQWVSPMPANGGVLYWQVKGKNSAGDETGWSPTRSLTVQTPFPPCDTPQLQSPPTEQDFEIPATVNLQWAGNCDQYYVEWYGNAISGNSNWIHATTWQIQESTETGKVYWHVKGRTTQGAISDWSETWNFDLTDTDPPLCPAPTLVDPPDGATFNWDAQIDLTWNGNCEEYWCEVSWAGGGGNSGWTRQKVHRAPMPSQFEGANVTWKVKGRNIAQVETSWSNTRSYTVVPRPTLIPRPTPPVPWDPPKGSHFSHGTQVALRWNAVSGASLYALEVWKTGYYWTEAGINNVEYPTQPLNDPGLYYWHVAAKYPNSDYSDWSENWYFYID